MAGANILIVEDDPFEAEQLQLDLVHAGHRVMQIVDNGADLVDAVRQDGIDLLIIDIVLSGQMDGIQAAEQIREFSAIPIIFLTAYEDDDFLRRAERTQPAAYLLKPYRKRELIFLIKVTLTRYQFEQDLRQAKQEAEAALWHLATHDPLTRLPNRAVLLDRLEQFVSKARRHKQQFAVLFVDLDNFKRVNDSYGHGVGDGVLQRVAARIATGMREGDTVARLGGDEFVVLAELEGRSQTGASEIARKLSLTIGEKIDLEGRHLALSCSCGICIYPRDGADAQTLLRNADTAMYLAKEQGRNNYQFYSADLTTRAFEHLRMESNLRNVLEREEFELHYQPQLDTRSGRLLGVEVLVRWRRTPDHLIMPGQFIPLAEETGLITPISEWIFATACRQMHSWLQAGVPVGYIAVNLSNASTLNEVLRQKMAAAIDAAGCPATLVELEITESHLMCDPRTAAHQLHTFREMGFGLAVDDFGTGYSSLSYLKQLPLTKLKVDRSFIQDLTIDPSDAAITRAIITLGRSLGLTTIAEGVETQAQADFLAQEGCDGVQGFLFARPMPAAELERYIAERSAAIAPNDPTPMNRR